MRQLLATPGFWLNLGLTPLVCLLPDVIMKLYQGLFHPNPIDKALLRSKEISLPDEDLIKADLLIPMKNHDEVPP